jgi:hypothetical protein
VTTRPPIPLAGSAIAALAVIAVLACVIALWPPPERPSPVPSGASSPSQPGFRSFEPAPIVPSIPAPPDGFPVGEYGIRVTEADDPPAAAFIGDLGLVLGADGRYSLYGIIDTEGWYSVDGANLWLHADPGCSNTELIGRYRWAERDDRLVIELGPLGDSCRHRPYLLTVHPWVRVEPSG